MSMPSGTERGEQSPDDLGHATPVTRVTARARARWLIPAGILAAILITMFVATMTIDAPVASVGVVVTAVWFAAMVVAAFAVRVPRVHSRLQFGLMLAMALVGSALLYVIFLGAGR